MVQKQTELENFFTCYLKKKENVNDVEDVQRQICKTREYA